MKRTTTLFTATVFLLTLGATQIWAQQPTSPKFTPAPYDSKVIDGSEQTSPNQTNQSEVYRSSRSSHSIGTDIGETTYDLQSNSAVARRVGIPFEGADSLIVITWTGDLNNSLAAPDRGTFYNKWDTSGWGPIPSQRLENLRTGWPDNVITETGKEFIISHDPSAYDMVTLTRPVAGEGNWTQNKPGFDGIWPRAATGGGDTIHVINARNFGGAAADENNFTQYHRSPDGGITWDIMNQVLPGIDTPSGYDRMSGDSYAIDARDSIVAIVAGDGTYNPVALWKSTDYGNTWTRTVVIEHPVPNANQGTQSGACPDDRWFTHDGTAHLLIDQSGEVHVFTGFMAHCNDGSGFVFYPFTDGIIYWNESKPTLTMPDDTTEIIAYTPHLDSMLSNGDISNTSEVANYFTSMSTMAMPVEDTATGNLYLFYTAPTLVPAALSSGGKYFRDVYGVFSEDDGLTWSEPVNLTNTAVDHRENVFLGAYRQMIDGEIHAAWQADNIPGLAVRGEMHSFVDNDIHYFPFTHCHFIGLPEIATQPVSGDSICVGGSTEITVDAPTASSYKWSPSDSLNCDTCQTVLANPTTPTTYTVEIEDSNGCQNATEFYVHVFQSAPTANFTANVAGSSVNFINLSSSAVSYEWDFGDGTLSNQTNPLHTYNDPGVYSVTLTAINPCGDDVHSIDSIAVSVEMEHVSEQVEVYPNPASGSFNIDLGMLHTQTNQISIYNTVGEKVRRISKSEISGKERLQVDLSGQATGIYFIRIQAEEGVATKKVTLTR